VSWQFAISGGLLERRRKFIHRAPSVVDVNFNVGGECGGRIRIGNSELDFN